MLLPLQLCPAVAIYLLTCYTFVLSCLFEQKGGDRQALHHAIREHSMDAGKVVKAEGKPNDLLDRIRKDPLFADVSSFSWSLQYAALYLVQPRLTPTSSLPFSRLQIHDELDALVDPMLFVGRAPEQVDEFIAEHIDPVLGKNKELLSVANQDTVSV